MQSKNRNYLTCFMSHNLALMAHCPCWSALDFWKMEFEKWIWTISNFSLFWTGDTGSKIKFQIDQKWSKRKSIFQNPFFKNLVQINWGTVVNMKVHTDPKNSYMHPFVWQSISVGIFFLIWQNFFLTWYIQFWQCFKMAKNYEI